MTVPLTWSGMSRRVLILGGTGEARALSHALDEKFGDSLTQIVSYAGVTRARPDLPGITRVGGFGGVEGLKDFLITQKITHLIDATHPFAKTISEHALMAVQGLSVQTCCLFRPPWGVQKGDRWIEADDFQDAAVKLSSLKGPVLLSVGIKELGAFAEITNRPVHVRLLALPGEEAKIKGWHYHAMRPPFDLESELAFIKSHAITTLVTKNSGGPQTYAKIEAARRRATDVVMIKRPSYQTFQPFENIASVLNWLGKSNEATGTKV